jgi:hypothetical protein
VLQSVASRARFFHNVRESLAFGAHDATLCIMQHNASSSTPAKATRKLVEPRRPSSAHSGIAVACRGADKEIVRELATEHGSPMATIVGGAVRAFKRLSPAERLPFIRESRP